MKEGAGWTCDYIYDKDLECMYNGLQRNISWVTSHTKFYNFQSSGLEYITFSYSLALMFQEKCKPWYLIMALFPCVLLYTSVILIETRGKFLKSDCTKFPYFSFENHLYQSPRPLVSPGGCMWVYWAAPTPFNQCTHRPFSNKRHL